MKRVLIIGPSGAGKSVLSAELGRLLGLPVIHLDQVFWRPGWKRTPRPEFVRKLRVILSRPRWIIDGNYGSTLHLRLRTADTVVFLDFPRWRSLVQVIRRIAAYHGRNRPDMAPGCPERLDLGFLRWVWGFHVNERPSVMETLKFLRRDQVLIDLKRPREVRRFLDGLRPGAR